MGSKVLLGIVIVLLCTTMVFGAVRTLYVDEGDFVQLEPYAEDQDNDKISFSYSAPLDDKGEWQTDFDDAGEYEIVIIASDGREESMEKVKLIVENKNQPPFLTETKLVAKEAQTIDLKSIVEDPDGDVVEFSFRSPFNDEGKWKPGFDDAGDSVTSFTFSDGEFEVEGKVRIEVLETNQRPEVVRAFSEGLVEVVEDQELEFFVLAKDGDGQDLSYRWTLDNELISEQESGKVDFDFESAGTHLLKVVISDGELSSEEEWTVFVEDKNRKPEVTLLPITAREGEKIVLELPEFDVDGDALSYSFDSPLDDTGEWQTNFDDAGNHEVRFTVSDGDFIEEFEAEITILDVDRAPGLVLPQRLEVFEGEELEWVIESEDPDGDQITLSVGNAPEGARLSQRNQELTWSPDFDVIRRKGGWWSNLLNRLRLEHFVLRSKTLPLNVSSCAQGLCSSGIVDLVVYNVNRAPELERVSDVEVVENEEVVVSPVAVDPDGDIPRYYFTTPLGKRSGKWQTGFDDEGDYGVSVTATDGRLEDTTSVDIEVEKSNREPSLKIRHDAITVNENHEFQFRVSGTDPDGDELEFSAEGAPAGSSFEEGVFHWTPGFDVVKDKRRGWFANLISKNSWINKKLSREKTDVWVTFVASDDDFEVRKPVRITVKNVNRAPYFSSVVPTNEIRVKTNEPVLFHSGVTDEDGDELWQVWDFGFGQDDVTGTDTLERTFTKPGEKNVKVWVTDGRKSIEKEWKVFVEGERVKPEVVKQKVEVEKVEREIVQPPATFKVVVIDH